MVRRADTRWNLEGLLVRAGQQEWPCSTANRIGRVLPTSRKTCLQSIVGRSPYNWLEPNCVAASGKYLGVMPDGIAPSFESRGLPISSLELPYNQFELVELPDGYSIEVSQIAPAFGRDGGALQVLVYNEEGIMMTVEQLIRDGLLQ